VEAHLKSALGIMRRALVSNDLEVSVPMSNVIGNALLLAKYERDAEFSFALLGIFQDWLILDANMLQNEGDAI